MNLNYLINRVKIIFKKDLVKVFSLSGVSTVVKLITGLIRTKIVALLLGPGGIALISQMNNTIDLFSRISNGGITTGVTKYIAEFRSSKDEFRNILSNSLKIILIFSTLTGFVLIVFSGYLARIILTDISYKSIFVIYGILIILFSLNRLLLAIINGNKDFTSFIKINIISNIVILIYSIGLIYYFGIYGALLSMVTSQSIIIGITVFVIFKKPWFKKKNFKGNFNSGILKKLSGFSLLTVFTFFLGPIATITIRSYIIKDISIDAAGYWSGVTRISGLVLMVVSQALTIYLIPRFSELTSKLKIRKEIINTYKLVIPLLLVSFTAIYFLRDFIINILFSSEFKPMGELFLFQFIGDFFRIVSWIISIQLIAKAMIKLTIITEVSFNLIYLGLSIYCIKTFGLIGVVYAWSINYFLYLILMTILFRKTLFLRYINE